MFDEDNLVVYPAHGVGKIESIDHKHIGNAECEFYIVRILASNIVMMVPVNNAENIGLRPLIKKTKAAHILSSLQIQNTGTVFTGQNWNRRFKEYSGRLKSADLTIVAEVLHELLLIGRNKELSFGERRLMEQAMSLVGGELAEVLDIPQSELRDDLLTRYAPLTEKVTEDAQ